MMAIGSLKIAGAFLWMNSRQLARINRFSAARDRLEVQLVSRDLYQHEALVRIKTLHALPGLAKVVRHQLAGIAQNKVVNIIFRLNPLVHVFMAGEHRVDPIALEEWQDLCAEIGVRTMAPAIVI